MSGSLRSRVEADERAAEALERDSERLRRDCATIEQRIAALTTTLQAAAKPRLGLGPLIWSTLAGLAALTSVFLTYLLAMFVRLDGRMDSDAPVAILAQGACLIIGAIGLALSRAPGAGGSAKTLARPLAFGLLVLSLVVSGLLILLSLIVI